jgi:D-alanyl-lipoteichoic acid acyltransferase DltB (MBOAT superfamily)
VSVASLGFAAFALVLLPLHYLLPARHQNTCLLLASYAFYATWGWPCVAILAALTLGNHWLGLRVRPAGPGRRWWLAVGVAFNVLALATLRWLHVGGIVPIVGASFYVLRAISFLADRASGALPVAPSLVDLALYLGYFPALLAGPIEDAASFLRTLRTPCVVDNAAVARSATLIAVGVVRKVLVADALARAIPELAFVAPEHLPGAVLAAAILGYAVFVYNDFAGYTGIVRGTSGLFGIPLSENFAQPFFARSLTDYWMRWHATLSRWLRNYVYLPMSRAILRRRPGVWSPANLVVPPLATMLVSGLWHGGTPALLVWGGLHGIFLIAERVGMLRRPRRAGRVPSRWRNGATTLAVFGLVVLAGVAFRMELRVALRFWASLVRPSGWTAPMEAGIVLPVVVSFALDWIQHRAHDEVVFLRWPRPVQAALLAAVVLVTWLTTRGTPGPPFVYQGF